jgi:hypothetical protein
LGGEGDCGDGGSRFDLQRERLGCSGGRHDCLQLSLVQAACYNGDDDDTVVVLLLVLVVVVLSTLSS